MMQGCPNTFRLVMTQTRRLEPAGYTKKKKSERQNGRHGDELTQSKTGRVVYFDQKRTLAKIRIVQRLSISCFFGHRRLQ